MKDQKTELPPVITRLSPVLSSTQDDKLHVEIEKAKEIMRCAANLYRGTNCSAEEAVKEAQEIAKYAFSDVELMVGCGK